MQLFWKVQKTTAGNPHSFKAETAQQSVAVCLITFKILLNITHNLCVIFWNAIDNAVVGVTNLFGDFQNVAFVTFINVAGANVGTLTKNVVKLYVLLEANMGTSRIDPPDL